MALRNQPYIPLYIQDFMSDEKLRECKAESIGVFIFLMCVLHKSERYGVISLKPTDNLTENKISNFAVKLTKHLPFCEKIIEEALIDLLGNKVLLLEEDSILQKRMIKDSEKSQTKISSGFGKKKKYSEKLSNPKWQKKRLKILERDNWKCQECGDTENTLQIHHKEYIKGLEPWEYEDSFLVTLCESCHKKISDIGD